MFVEFQKNHYVNMTLIHISSEYKQVSFWSDEFRVRLETSSTEEADKLLQYIMHCYEKNDRIVTYDELIRICQFKLH